MRCAARARAVADRLLNRFPTLRYINNHQKPEDKVNLFYSTPSCYLKAVHESNNTWSTKDDDFFPYASDPHSYWTGYYSSRPTLKYFERKGNNFLQVG